MEKIVFIDRDAGKLYTHKHMLNAWKKEEARTHYGTSFIDFVRRCNPRYNGSCLPVEDLTCDELIKLIRFDYDNHTSESVENIPYSWKELKKLTRFELYEILLEFDFPIIIYKLNGEYI